MEIKERPILLKRHEVIAILEERQTQLRRLVKPKDLEWMDVHQGLRESDNEVCCPYGMTGDLLWVRESFMPAPLETPHEEPREVRWNIAYGAGGQMECMAPAKYNPMLYNYERWKPSIHMPRWASRILLEIVSVRTERLQDISEADAKAEGSSELLCKGFTHKHGFELIWESINGAGRWKTNPWVWVIEFRKI